MYKKILVPLDGSESSFRALNEAVELAKITEGEITLIHVYSIGSSLVVSQTQEYFYNLALKKGEEILENGKKLAKAQGLKVKTLLIEGDAIEQIVNTAHGGYFELIVMGARGLSKVKELIVGSVSQGVIKNAPCPVLVTR